MQFRNSIIGRKNVIKDKLFGYRLNIFPSAYFNRELLNANNIWHIKEEFVA